MCQRCLEAEQRYGPAWQSAAVLMDKALGRPAFTGDRHSMMYLDRFCEHLELYPRDDNFLLDAQPGTFGVVTCMESSCYIDIRLEAHPDDPNEGGKLYGIGSLAAYHDHIQSSDAHRKARDERQYTAAKIAKDYENKAVVQQGVLHVPIPPEQTTAALKPPQQHAPPSHPPLPHTDLQTPLKNQQHVSSSSSTRQAAAAAAASSSISRTSSSNSSAHKAGPSRASSLDKRPRSPFDLTSANKRPMLASGSKTPVIDIARYEQAWASVRAEIYDIDAAQYESQQTLRSYSDALLKVVDPALRQKYTDALKRIDVEISAMQQTHRELLRKDIQLSEAIREAMASRRAFPNLPTPAPPLAKAAASAAGLLKPAGLVHGVDFSDDDDVMAPLYQADNADFQEFLKAVQGADFEGNATVQEAAQKLGLMSQSDKIPGMNVHLLPHQLIGVAWMVEQEVKGKNYGAILADDMGLGKTIQTIGLMCKNPSKEDTCKTTLIIAPLSLLSQWKEEIEEKCQANRFSVHIYHGKGRSEMTKKKHLLRHDVILTTYHTLLGEYPDEEAAQKRAKKQAKQNGHPDNWEQYIETTRKGLLFQTEWFRVVLDEAHVIRNRQTKMSRAVTHLDSLFRWCLTGTPILNSLADIYALLRFLQVKPWYDWAQMNTHVVKEEKRRPDIAAKRAQAILASCMIRRRKDTKLDGKELITLPEKVCDDTLLELSPEERSIYDAVERKSQVAFNKFMKAGTVMKNYANVLTMLLRLRQVCLHPALILEGEDILATSKTAEEELSRAKMLLGHVAVNKIREARLAVAKERAEKERSAKDGEEIELEADECPICFSPVQESEEGGVYTKCSHLFCRACIVEVLQKDAEDDGAHNGNFRADERPCPNCRGPVSPAMLFPLSVFEPSDEELEPFLSVPPSPQKKAATVKAEPDQKMIILDSDDEEDAGPVMKKLTQFNRAIIQDSDDEDEGIPTLGEITNKGAKAAKKADKGKEKAKDLPGWMAHQEPSTKMKWALEEVLRVQKENPDDKIIIISSFTTALDMVDDMFQANGIATVRYQGDMTREYREEAVRKFKKSHKCKIMLLSLHSGGVGLNLTRANRVISLDLAWNKACESQAFDRCHRIGQTKKVQINRMMIDKTVEQRIAELQIRKQNLADGALAEGKGQKIKRLTVAELANLFGLDRYGRRL
ncbi:hypothetical protein OIV83_000572 [Microbotryomycetes sp. JL201]|nr:hypothetical protein OIV83_000572 [Microbotryomycetes sp. JL201]